MKGKRKLMNLGHVRDLPEANELVALIARAEAGDVQAARRVIARAALGDWREPLLEYLQRCCKAIQKGTSAEHALHLVRARARPEIERETELDRRHEICLEVLRQHSKLDGRDRLQRAKGAAGEALGLSPRAVRSAWEDRSARLAALLSLQLELRSS